MLYLLKTSHPTRPKLNPVLCVLKQPLLEIFIKTNLVVNTIVIDRYGNFHLTNTDTDTDMLIITYTDTDTDTDMKKTNSPIPIPIPIRRITNSPIPMPIPI